MLVRSAHTGDQLHPLLERVMMKMNIVHVLNALALAFAGGYWASGIMIMVN